jgi:hypothetical protein
MRLSPIGSLSGIGEAFESSQGDTKLGELLVI